MFVCPPPLFLSLLRVHRHMIHITGSSLSLISCLFCTHGAKMSLQLTHVLFCLSNMSYCIESHIYLYISHVFPLTPPLSVSPLFSSSSLFLSLYLLSFCVAQSLLVPGKSPSKYGRRGSAIGIGTVEEVHV